MTLLTVTAVITAINCIVAIYQHNISAALGWGAAFCMTMSRIAKELEE
jgi:hypothetical protein